VWVSFDRFFPAGEKIRGIRGKGENGEGMRVELQISSVMVLPTNSPKENRRWHRKKFGRRNKKVGRKASLLICEMIESIKSG